MSQFAKSLLRVGRRSFSSLSPWSDTCRTSYEHFTPIQYNLISTAQSDAPRLSELKTDCIVIPIHHDAEDKTIQMMITSDQTNADDGQLPPETPLNLSKFFDFEAMRLLKKHGNRVPRLLSESGILEKESKFKHIVSTSHDADAPRQIMVVSLGKAPSASSKSGNSLVPPSLQCARGLSTIINNALSSNKSLSSCSIYIPQSVDLSVGALVESLNICSHKDRRFKSSKGDDTKEHGQDKATQSTKTMTILSDKSADGQRDEVPLAECVASGVRYARELVNAPANVITPKGLAESAQSMQSDWLDCKILDVEQCKALNMWSYLAVGACSKNAPHFIHLKLKAPGSSEQNAEQKKKIVLIGKGVCFDSGGYNIKAGAGSSIEMMKYDMAGSAAVLGSFAALSRYLEQEPVFAKELLSRVEETAMHPGDVIQSAEGLSIEVTNTDAEGRLTLADAIWYARQLGGDEIVDLATLTGAQKVATGKKIAGMFSNDDSLADALLDSAYQTGERLWRMPLFDDCDCDGGENSYKNAMESEIADLQNAEKGGAGGSITAALFLKRFVESTRHQKKVPKWAHLDVAGPVWRDKKGHEQSHVGATGYGVRLLTHFILNK